MRVRLSTRVQPRPDGRRRSRQAVRLAIARFEDASRSRGARSRAARSGAARDRAAFYRATGAPESAALRPGVPPSIPPPVEFLSFESVRRSQTIGFRRVGQPESSPSRWRTNQSTTTPSAAAAEQASNPAAAQRFRRRTRSRASRMSPRRARRSSAAAPRTGEAVEFTNPLEVECSAAGWLVLFMEVCAGKRHRRRTSGARCRRRQAGSPRVLSAALWT